MPSGRTAVGFDETASKKGHNCVTVFIDTDAESDPVVFATPGKVAQFRAFPEAHGGEPGRIVEVVCDMSPAVLAAVGEQFPDAAVTVDWFHVVQLSTSAVDAVRKAERKQVQLPVALRGAQSGRRQADRRTDGRLGRTASRRLPDRGGRADQAKAPLGCAGPKPRTARAGGSPTSCATPVSRSATAHSSKPSEKPWRPSRRTANGSWSAGPQSHSNARPEAMNGLFQAARARGSRNTATFVTMLYLIAAPLGDLFEST